MRLQIVGDRGARIRLRSRRGGGAWMRACINMSALAFASISGGVVGVCVHGCGGSCGFRTMSLEGVVAPCLLESLRLAFMSGGVDTH